MKTILVIFLLFSINLLAENNEQEKKPDQSQHQHQSEMTKRDAKALCKQEGKKGQELKECMREKTK